ncbi:NADH-quinone oxidoreductase subunit C, partial [Campylobacter lari]
MRKYSDKKNAQLKNYYEDRFYHAPATKKLSTESSAFESDHQILSQEFELKNSFIELDFWVIEINKDDNVAILS